jgi:hypothetical protein
MAMRTATGIKMRRKRKRRRNNRRSRRKRRRGWILTRRETVRSDQDR